MKRILIGYLTNENCGIDRYIINAVKLLDKQRFQFDFLYSSDSVPEKPILADFNPEYIKIPTIKHPVKQYKEMRRILKEGNYDVAYFNISTAMPLIPVLACHKSKVNKIIIHSHNTNVNETSKIKNIIYLLLHKVCKGVICKFANGFAACSDLAGKWMFTKKILNDPRYTIIKNAIDTDNFIFDDNKRTALRNELGISDSFTVGHIGSYNFQKNHSFILSVFSEIHKINNKTILLLIGEGELKQDITQLICELGLSDCIKQLGYRTDVSDLLNAMDVFLLPSRFEGLPFVGVEAQTNGLQCFFSDVITREINITDLAHFISLKQSPETWAKEILQSNYNYDRHKYASIVSENGFDIKVNTKFLERFFLQK